MPAPKGNNYTQKYKTEAEQVKVFEEYCKHIASGFSKESFVPCDYRTIESYIEKYPEVLHSIKMQEAFRANRKFWESVGMEGMLGQIDGFNPTSWIFNMKNRFGWKDKKEIDQNMSGEVKVTINDLQSIFGKTIALDEDNRTDEEAG